MIEDALGAGGSVPLGAAGAGPIVTFGRLAVGAAIGVSGEMAGV